ncbi:zinc-dependent metalloprotease [Ruania albidiflava]|uniref:zinc-dependent metalloprotease n=1 Tax=Ruania albidiflava TaxID=366586 RepID=UPI0003B3C5E0|nr:zinc-dependent metalloprotease [Ruania albidiflava]
MTEDDPREQMRRMLEQMLGPEAAEEALRALEASGMDPAAWSSAGMPVNPEQLQAAMAQMRQVMAAGDDDESRWRMAHDVARQVAHSGGDPSVTAAEADRARSILSVADLWLDAATELPPSGGQHLAVSRAEWVERTLPTWRTVAEPVGSSVAEALSELVDPEQLAEQGLNVPEIPMLAGLDIGSMMRTMGSLSFAMQVGQAAGTLSREVFGGTDVGLPLLAEPALLLVPANVAEFAEGLDAPAEEVWHFLAVREAAHARLFTHVPWLRAHLLGAVEDYARGIEIDLGQMEESMRGIDPTNMDQLRSAMAGGIFAPHHTEAQTRALTRLETALALVEGWVEEVTARAVAPHLPHAVPLREMLRRRRAAGGPAEDTFRTLVGLELRPRRARDAATLWALVGTKQGSEARDALWSHPDVFPSTADLDSPTDFLQRRAASAEETSEIDAALEALLDGTLGTETSPADGPDATESAPSPEEGGSTGTDEDPGPGGDDPDRQPH